jgi:hypothetical protein
MSDHRIQFAGTEYGLPGERRKGLGLAGWPVTVFAGLIEAALFDDALNQGRRPHEEKNFLRAHEAAARTLIVFEASGILFLPRRPLSVTGRKTRNEHIFSGLSQIVDIVGERRQSPGCLRSAGPAIGSPLPCPPPFHAPYSRKNLFSILNREARAKG